jgi:hypothetical protein
MLVYGIVYIYSVLFYFIIIKLNYITISILILEKQIKHLKKIL